MRKRSRPNGAFALESLKGFDYVYTKGIKTGLPAKIRAPLRAWDPLYDNSLLTWAVT